MTSDLLARNALLMRAAEEIFAEARGRGFGRR
jgi:hypothetical protein